MGLGAAAALAASMSACSSQPQPGATAGGNQVALKFDLSQCQQISPNLFKCPAIDKPLCTAAYNKGDVICVKVDENGVVVQQFQ
jgi:hypothetical protein